MGETATHTVSLSDLLTEGHIKQLAAELEREIVAVGHQISYVWCIFLFLALIGAALAIRKFAMAIVVKITQGTDNTIDDFVATVFEHLTKPETLVATSAYVATTVFPLTATINMIIKTIFTVILTLKIIGAAQSAAEFLLAGQFTSKKQEKDESTVNLTSNFSKAIKIGLWGAGILFILENIGFDITSIVAGLGIGGIAIALAMQGILTDTFNSFVLFFDKPFHVGDVITVGGITGVVSRIGFKTTKVRALTGELVVISNSILTSTMLQNFTQAKEMNRLTTVTVDNDTPTETLKKLPEAIMEAINTVDRVKAVQVYFREYGATGGLCFEVRFQIKSNDASVYRECCGFVHTAITEKMRELKVILPYPTTRIRMHPDHIHDPLHFKTI